MPTYVYECKDCGHRFELFQSFSAEALTTCPECMQDALRKVLFPAGVVFKGSGFYVNDSRSPRPTASTTGAKSKDGKDSAVEKAPTTSNGSSGKDREPAKSKAE